MAAETIQKSQRGNLHQGSSPKEWAGSRYSKANDKTPGTSNNTDFSMSKAFEALMQSNEVISKAMEESPFLAEFVSEFVEVLKSFGEEVSETIAKSQEEQLKFNLELEDVVKSLNEQTDAVDTQTQQLAEGDVLSKSARAPEVLVKSHPGDVSETPSYSKEEINDALWKSFEAGEISGLDITKYETSANGQLDASVARKIGLSN